MSTTTHDAPTTAPEVKRPPLGVIRVVNRVMRPLLRSPLHGLVSKRLLLLTFTGRTSGKRYSTPIGYVRADDATLLMSSNSPWRVNLRGGAPVEVRLRGERRTGRAELIEDESGLADGFRAMLTQDPGLSRFIGVALGPDGEPDPAAVRQARERGYAVIRIGLDA